MPPASMITSAFSTSATDADPTRVNAIAVGDNRVTGDERRLPIPGNDLTEVDDRDLHESLGINA